MRVLLLAAPSVGCVCSNIASLSQVSNGVAWMSWHISSVQVFSYKIVRGGGGGGREVKL